MNRDPAVLEQRIQHLVVTAPILPAARVDHDIDLLGHQLAMPGLKKEIWTIIKADRFLTDDEVRFKTWDLVIAYLFCLARLPAGCLFLRYTLPGFLRYRSFRPTAVVHLKRVVALISAMWAHSQRRLHSLSCQREPITKRIRHSYPVSNWKWPPDGDDQDRLSLPTRNDYASPHPVLS